MEPAAVQNRGDTLGNIHPSEQLYFSMFPNDSSPTFRRFLLFVVYNTIQNEDGITLNKIKWKLGNEYSFHGDDVEIAINALSNAKIFNAVSKYHLHPKKESGRSQSGRRDGRDRGKQDSETQPIIHLRVRKEGKAQIGAWIDALLRDHPEYVKIMKA